MKKKLLVHAGVHRTGTTALQGLLSANADQLKRNGIIYPKYFANPEAVNHTQLAWDIHDETCNQEDLRNWAESLDRKHGHLVILSAEDFSILTNLAFLNHFLDLFDVEVVFYLRRQDEWINSWYNQHVKWPINRYLSRCTPIEFLGHLDEFHWISYFDLVSRWADKVGKENIRIRVVEKGEISDSAADFCSLCGIDFELETKLGTRHNESMPASQIEILRRLGTHQYSRDVLNLIYEALRQLRSSPDSNVYDRPVRELILSRYQAQNQLVAEHYLGRKDGVLFRDQDLPGIAQSADHFIDNDALFSFARHLIAVFSSGGDSVAPVRSAESNYR